MTGGLFVQLELKEIVDLLDPMNSNSDAEIQNETPIETATLSNSLDNSLFRNWENPMKKDKVRCLGHIWRSSENNQTRAYTFKNLMGSRTRGRPPTRWINDVENDLRTLNIKNWQRVAAYRWKKRAVEAAKTCNRLLRL
ncbi:endonuclease-reverse transcriptase [Trichonephila clavipes]|nr:endonuclease-reverse transcriptase [Trichonephila clavipes]